MALQTVRVTLTAEDTKTFTFDKPAGDYGKGFGVTITSGSGSTPSFAADVDNLDDTMTGTINFEDPITGVVDVQIYDRQ